MGLGSFQNNLLTNVGIDNQSTMVVKTLVHIHQNPSTLMTKRILHIVNTLHSTLNLLILLKAPKCHNHHNTHNHNFRHESLLHGIIQFFPNHQYKLLLLCSHVLKLLNMCLFPLKREIPTP